MWSNTFVPEPNTPYYHNQVICHSIPLLVVVEQRAGVWRIVLHTTGWRLKPPRWSLRLAVHLRGQIAQLVHAACGANN